MTNYELMKAAAFAGDTGGGGGGGGGDQTGNLITTDIEQGYYDKDTMAAVDSDEYCRVHGTVPCTAGVTYALVWACLNGKSIKACVRIYTANGLYISGTNTVKAPVQFTTDTGSPAKLTIMFKSAVSGVAISPEDIGVPTLVRQV